MEPSVRNFKGNWHRSDNVGLSLVVLLGVVACLGTFLLDGRIGFSLWDEGYLWYGVQQVLHGEVPIRDFMSYDPGRYYWAAGLLRLFHADGIVAVRAATMAFVAIGVAAGGVLVWHQSPGRDIVRFGKCALAIALLVMWAVPWWKGYDAALSVILTASLAWVLTRPSAARFFLHGVVIGVAAMIGRNHGVYGVIACLVAAPLLLLGTSKPAWRQCIPAWTAGVVLGFAPICFSLVLDHRFAAMFWDSIRFMLFEYKGTNLPLPVPWPWTMHGGGALTLSLVTQWLTGSLFVLLPLFCIVGLAVVLNGLRRERNMAHAGFVACVATAIPYLNVAFSRADVSHLAQAICPLLIGLLIFPVHDVARSMHRWLVVPLLLIVSLLITIPLHPWYQSRVQSGWRVIDVRGDKLRMSDAAAAPVEAVERLANRCIPNGSTLLAAPVWPGAYALLGVKSPVWEIYPLFPRGDGFQNQEIARLQQARPSLILIYDISVDGREDLRYAHTHPRVWEFVSANYRQIPGPDNLPGLLVYIPKSTVD
ncbi:hypothetical protein GCM10008098_01520 [Rhodanobacter panaciterrae]|uniref:Glycosyltransferase RgtA/B/C/D-like domain-containing protein n=2 Tax=Rhodanobacter panaciterrae TaxID=490572 RepID=A0ABQ2ZHG8_9GAMM|nr:hypothetical protein GCM10008098_01520 [Rhodanobacter panaciterrae]